MPWFFYPQNNSGGRFYKPAVDVWIEANSAEEANQLAEERVGIYFEGCESGLDCECCGDRWRRRLYDNQGQPYPYIDDERIGEISLIDENGEFLEEIETIVESMWDIVVQLKEEGVYDIAIYTKDGKEIYYNSVIEADYGLTGKKVRFRRMVDF